MRVFYRGLRKLVRRQTADQFQAGSIVIKDTSEGRKVLLVTNKKGDKWIFPKGGVERKETPEEAAERETEEEAGVSGSLIAYVGAAEYQEDKDTTVRVDYFLLRALARLDENDGRKVRWCTIDEALELIDAPELKLLLSRAWPEIEKVD
jgi:8-oxo-dGTP pyrophosphatase MutT (NUDIX family)